MVVVFGFLAAAGEASAGVATQTLLVSQTTRGTHMRHAGGGPAAISGSGRFIVFERDDALYLRDLKLRTTRRITKHGMWPAISRNGRFIAWATLGSASGAPSNVWEQNRVTGARKLIDVNSAGMRGNRVSYAPSLSATGRYAAFTSGARNLVAHDTNDLIDTFVRDRRTGRTVRVSVGGHGQQGNGRADGFPVISATGRYVIFDSLASNLVKHDTNDVADVFVRDLQERTTSRVSVSSSGAQGDARSLEVGGISDDGRYALYDSEADNLVPNDTDLENDVFVRDRQRHTTTRVSVSSTGAPGDAGEYQPSISGDGRWVAFASFTSLAPGDTNFASDVYLHDMQTGQTTLESVNSSGTPANGSTLLSALSADGRWIVFTSTATNLSPLDHGTYQDNYVRGPLR
jgi:Tol biopolymer transport system component